jgi:hypothetical protein
MGGDDERRLLEDLYYPARTAPVWARRTRMTTGASPDLVIPSNVAARSDRSITRLLA